MDNQTVMEIFKQWQLVTYNRERELLSKFAPSGAKTLHSPTWGTEFMHFWYLSKDSDISLAVVPMEKWFEFLDAHKSKE